MEMRGEGDANGGDGDASRPHTNGARADWLEFLSQFLRHPLRVGSVVPSSRFLERRILEAARVAEADTVVELGPGTGGTTRAILGALPAHGRLLTVEINPVFHRRVRAIGDARLIAHLGSAFELADILAHYGLPAPDAVISGIPFSTLPASLGARLARTIGEVLAPGGRFVAYQARDRVAQLCAPVLGGPETVTELRNIPPMRVYRWTARAPLAPGE